MAFDALGERFIASRVTQVESFGFGSLSLVRLLAIALQRRSLVTIQQQHPNGAGNER